MKERIHKGLEKALNDAIKLLLVQNNDKEKVAQLVEQYLTNPNHADKMKYKLKVLIQDDDIMF